MPGATPIYGFPFELFGDDPHGPDATEDLANAVEAQLARTDALVDHQVFTGSGTWTKLAGAKSVRVCVQAGGGAGGGAPATGAGQGSAGHGAGAGGYAEGWFAAAALAATVAVTVGAAGVPVSGAAGGAGGSSSFGAHVVATGGAGGGVIAAGSITVVADGALGGVGTTGQILSGGGDGFGASRLVLDGAVVYTTSAAGGASRLGGNTPNRQIVGVGSAGKAYGGGGQGSLNGASLAAKVGGAGSLGLVIVTTYF